MKNFISILLQNSIPIPLQTLIYIHHSKSISIDSWNVRGSSFVITQNFDIHSSLKIIYILDDFSEEDDCEEL